MTDTLTWVRGNVPPAEGWYAVMHPGDSESIDGHTIYEFGDYQDFARWTPAEPDELEDFDDGYKGHWMTQHDEDGDGIFAFYGPLLIPAFKP
jgi:hypothetical protein